MSSPAERAVPVLYWRPGCPFCLALKLRLRIAGLPYRAVNIWQDERAADLVRQHNGGDETVPTVQVGDTMLTNPAIADIRRAIASASRTKPSSDTPN